MKRILASIFTALIVLSASAQELKWARKPLKIATYNIQLIYPKPARAAWPIRIPIVTHILDKYDFDLVGVQEPYLTQIEDIMKRMGSEYECVGACVNGDNSSREEPFNLILYKKLRLICLDHGVIWFTPEPGKPGYRATSPRMCIWGKFKDKKTKKMFYYFNCHLDHQSSFSRARSAEIIVNKVKEMSQGLPCIVGGDFNAKEDAQAYRYLMGSGLFADALFAVENPINSEYASHNKYKPLSEVPKNGLHLDHILYTPSNSKATSWHLITDMPGGKWGSDHFPILMEWYPANPK